MKVALSVWDSRISPVFDTAHQLWILEVSEREILAERLEVLGEDPLHLRAEKLRKLGIDVLICGAISRPLADTFIASGIKLLPFVAGLANDVVRAYLSGALPCPDYQMPGCANGRRRLRQRRGNRRFEGCRAGKRYQNEE